MRSGACSWAIRGPLPFKYALASTKSIASQADLSCTLCGKEDVGWATLSRHTEIPLRHASILSVPGGKSFRAAPVF